MIQPSISSCLLGGLFGLILLGPVLMAPTQPALCTALKTLNGSLSYRRRFMKHNFPINYTIKVHYKEVFKLSNIRRLRQQVDGLEDLVLQRLWFVVNQRVLKKVLRVMSDRHPSRKYTAELESRFRDTEGVFVHSHPPEVLEKELPEHIQEFWDKLTEEPERVRESSWRAVSPKFLLDNFHRTMHCLFRDCFPSKDPRRDYCGVSHWRKGRKKDTLQPPSQPAYTLQAPSQPPSQLPLQLPSQTASTLQAPSQLPSQPTYTLQTPLQLPSQPAYTLQTASQPASTLQPPSQPASTLQTASTAKPES